MVFESDLMEIISRLPEVSTRRTLEWFGDRICCNSPAKAGTARTDKNSTANFLRITRVLGSNHVMGFIRTDKQTKGGYLQQSPRGQGLTGKAITNYAKAVWAAYPDASVELITAGDAGAGLVAVQWVMRGTNSGPLPDGTPATGRPVTFGGLPSLRLRGTRFARNKSKRFLRAKRRSARTRRGLAASQCGRLPLPRRPEWLRPVLIDDKASFGCGSCRMANSQSSNLL
jgi:hypothetical protein